MFASSFEELDFLLCLLFGPLTTVVLQFITIIILLPLNE